MNNNIRICNTYYSYTHKYESSGNSNYQVNRSSRLMKVAPFIHNFLFINARPFCTMSAYSDCSTF